MHIENAIPIEVGMKAALRRVVAPPVGGFDLVLSVVESDDLVDELGRATLHDADEHSCVVARTAWCVGKGARGLGSIDDGYASNCGELVEVDLVGKSRYAVVVNPEVVRLVLSRLCNLEVDIGVPASEAQVVSIVCTEQPFAVLLV